MSTFSILWDDNIFGYSKTTISIEILIIYISYASIYLRISVRTAGVMMILRMWDSLFTESCPQSLSTVIYVEISFFPGFIKTEILIVSRHILCINNGVIIAFLKENKRIIFLLSPLFHELVSWKGSTALHGLACPQETQRIAHQIQIHMSEAYHVRASRRSPTQAS